MGNKVASALGTGPAQLHGRLLVEPLNVESVWSGLGDRCNKVGSGVEGEASCPGEYPCVAPDPASFGVVVCVPV